jgi:hypothetical protein
MSLGLEIAARLGLVVRQFDREYRQQREDDQRPNDQRGYGISSSHG